MAIHGPIFDFDGVMADSEVLANAVLAETVSSLGRMTTLADALSRYTGKPWPEVIALIESDVGQGAPPDFAACLEAKTFERFRAELCEVKGAREFIDRFPEIPQCIASSSSSARLRLCLEGAAFVRSL
jgi:beta-phosphoglucomutase-like phosphatase (HAD superfamily)